MHVASRGGYNSVVELLIKKGADLSIVNKVNYMASLLFLCLRNVQNNVLHNVIFILMCSIVLEQIIIIGYYNNVILFLCLRNVKIYIEKFTMYV